MKYARKIKRVLDLKFKDLLRIQKALDTEEKAEVSRGTADADNHEDIKEVDGK